MMLLITTILLATAVTAAPPVLNYSNDNIQVLRYENDNLGGGKYRYAFEQSDGTKHEQEGELRNGGGQEEDFLVIRGFYSWVGPDGVTYSVTYLADENGFKPNIEQGTGGVVPGPLLG